MLLSPMSVLKRITDSTRTSRHVRKVPKAEVADGRHAPFLPRAPHEQSYFVVGLRSVPLRARTGVHVVSTNAVLLHCHSLLSSAIATGLGADKLAAMAAPANRATATNPVIVRCFVMGTSGPPAIGWVAGTAQRFKGSGTKSYCLVLARKRLQRLHTLGQYSGSAPRQTKCPFGSKAPF